mmetsp:Transcript_30753/g.43653  ORF Transcript_30753/g.43653 Transcript_30753/m.43653 type:complete len:451 (-) Transcript_30753:342-1694(-)
MYWRHYLPLTNVFVLVSVMLISVDSLQQQQQQQQQLYGVTRRSSPSRSVLYAETPSSTGTKITTTKTTTQPVPKDESFHHGLAILTIPQSSSDRIANEAILETALQKTKKKLSIVLRSGDNDHSLASLRKYVGEVYSTLWDCAMGFGQIMDVVVYPQNLPNSAPERWVQQREDLDFVCSHETICGWVSKAASGRGKLFQDSEGQGLGGLQEHVAAINADRLERGYTPVISVPVDPWPKGADRNFQTGNNVVFMDDEASSLSDQQGHLSDGQTHQEEDDGVLLGGARIEDNTLFQSVAVGGTFDGMHYGHRKLLTLAVSSVTPQTGKLLIGVTVDEMLQHKQFSELIPPFEQRIAGVREFVHRLAPGIKNRVRVVPISDSYGPPGSKDGAHFDALVLSHETLENGYQLNKHRVDKLGMPPLTLLCTRRTEAYGMSSTTLRKLRNQENDAGL